MEAIKKNGIAKQIKNISIIIISSLILTISSKIQTPLAPVPVTMQTFAVLFLGMAFGYKIATASVILYLFQGAIGLPVFAKGGGLIYFQGPTSGYLFARVVDNKTFTGVNDKKVTSFNSSRYLVLSLNTGPIIIRTPSS